MLVPGVTWLSLTTCFGVRGHAGVRDRVGGDRLAVEHLGVGLHEPFDQQRRVEDVLALGDTENCRAPT